MPEFELSVYVHEGRSFPRGDEDFYRIGGLFDDEPRSTVRLRAPALSTSRLLFVRDRVLPSSS